MKSLEKFKAISKLPLLKFHAHTFKQKDLNADFITKHLHLQIYKNLIFHIYYGIT